MTIRLFRRAALCTLSLAALASCAASPNYVGDRQLTPGEVPRDEYGQPVLEAMRPPPPPPPERTVVPPELLADIPPARPLPTSPDRPQN